MNIKVLTKITYIVFVSLLFYSTSYGKISKEYYNAIFEGCMDGALKVNNNYHVAKKYCECSADHFNKNYDNNSLIKLLDSEGGSAYNDVINFVSVKCNKKVGLN